MRKITSASIITAIEKPSVVDNSQSSQHNQFVEVFVIELYGVRSYGFEREISISAEKSIEDPSDFFPMFLEKKDE